MLLLNLAIYGVEVVSTFVFPFATIPCFKCRWQYVTSCNVYGNWVSVNLAAYNQPGMRVVASGYNLLHEVRVRPADVILQSEHEHAVAHQDCGSCLLVFPLPAVFHDDHTVMIHLETCKNNQGMAAWLATYLLTHPKMYNYIFSSSSLPPTKLT